MSIPVQSQRATIGTFELSATHDGDVDVILTSLDGWGSPGSTVDVQQNARSHGAWAGDAYLDPRYPTLQGYIVAPTRAQAVAAFDDLAEACALDSATLTVIEGDLTRHMDTRRKGEILHEVVGPNGSTIKWSVVLVATDPRKYGESMSGSTGLPSTSGGMTFPVEFPFTFDESVASGRVSLTNPGNIEGPVRLRITAGVGGLTGPKVTHVASGRSLEFATTLTIPEGNWIDVDMRAQTVLENGQPGAARNGWVTGRGWSWFQPGGNEWAFTAESGLGTLLVEADPAWQ